MIDCILLAAGNARRFGENKLMFPVEGTPMVERAITLHASLSYRRRVLITQTGYAQISAFAKANGFHVAYNAHPERGLGSSVRDAIAYLERLGAVSDGVLFGVCDQPYLRISSVQALMDCFERAQDRISALASASRRGNPIIFPKALLDELKALDDDKGGVEVVKAHPELVTFLRIADEIELRDIDRKKDTQP